MPCAMDNSRNCGAHLRNHVYRVPSKKDNLAISKPLQDSGLEIQPFNIGGSTVAPGATD